MGWIIVAVGLVIEVVVATMLLRGYRSGAFVNEGEDDG